jgi:hypothetical protein
MRYWLWPKASIKAKQKWEGTGIDYCAISRKRSIHQFNAFWWCVATDGEAAAVSRQHNWFLALCRQPQVSSLPFANNLKPYDPYINAPFASWKQSVSINWLVAMWTCSCDKICNFWYCMHTPKLLVTIILRRLQLSTALHTITADSVFSFSSAY